jgi:hypothetical protein
MTSLQFYFSLVSFSKHINPSPRSRLNEFPVKQVIDSDMMIKKYKLIILNDLMRFAAGRYHFSSVVFSPLNRYKLATNFFA